MQMKTLSKFASPPVRFAFSCGLLLSVFGFGRGVFAEIPDGVALRSGVAYLPEGRREKADLYLPSQRDAASKSPAVVIIHGGGWTGGKRNGEREVNIGVTLARNGYVAMSIDYLLATGEQPSWPVNIRDCQAAVRWLRVNAGSLQVDAARIGAIGGSAGGHLVSLLALSGNDPGFPPGGVQAGVSASVQCAVSMYGAAEVRDGKNALIMLGKTRQDAPELYALASPVSHVDPKDPPFLILHGSADKVVPVDQSERLARALAAGGVAHELVVIPDAPHSFHLQPKQMDLRALVIGFLDKHLKASP